MFNAQLDRRSRLLKSQKVVIRSYIWVGVLQYCYEVIAKPHWNLYIYQKAFMAFIIMKLKVMNGKDIASRSLTGQSFCLTSNLNWQKSQSCRLVFFGFFCWQGASLHLHASCLRSWKPFRTMDSAKKKKRYNSTPQTSTCSVNFHSFNKISMWEWKDKFNDSVSQIWPNSPMTGTHSAVRAFMTQLC